MHLFGAIVNTDLAKSFRVDILSDNYHHGKADISIRPVERSAHLADSRGAASAFARSNSPHMNL
jgi:hypothetical protein